MIIPQMTILMSSGRGVALMEEAVRRVGIVRAFGNGRFERRTDEVLEEKTVSLVVDGREEASVILTPGNEEEWALGHLACRRAILSMDDVASLEVAPGRVLLARRVTREGIPLKTRLVHTASTRLVERSRVMEALPRPLPVDWTVPFETVQEAIAELSAAPLFGRTGSVHVVVLVSVEKDGERFRVEDVGRHNAVDKAAGWAIRKNLDLSRTFLAVSGRLPADMVLKAIGARIPLLASVSAATAAGVDAALEGGVTLIGFAREGRMNIYSVPERIEGYSKV